MSEPQKRAYWLDYLRAFITVLVVAHHAALAYTTFAYFDKETYIHSTAPVVDNARWMPLDIFVTFNDIFFMSLMFMISGLFLFQSLKKKQGKQYLIDRARRLGIPFIIAVTLIIPIAYLPAFYLASDVGGLAAFIPDYIIHQAWPVGPPWFLWVLFLFTAIAVVIYIASPTFYYQAHHRLTQLAQKPLRLFLIWFTITLLAFAPLSLWVGQNKWTGLGPFDFQLNRILLYLSFFLTGAYLGSCPWQDLLFQRERLLNKTWVFWAFTCFITFGIVIIISIMGPEWVLQGSLNVNLAYSLYDIFFILSCLFCCCFFMALFRKKVNAPSIIMDHLAANAYGIYIIHYVFITWFQYALLEIPLQPAMKFSIVLLGALAGSWIVTHLIRKRIPL